MGKVKVYVDLMSQPSRAVTLFVKLNSIPHELKMVQIRKGEHLDSEYLSKIHKFGKVPAIVDEENNVIESIAILRYLSAKYPVADHWYPKDINKRTKVDEFLEWQHLGLRLPLSMFFQTKFIRPLISGKPAKPELIEFWKKKMEESLDQVEDIWLRDSPYLAGDDVTVADIIGLCEIQQPRMGGYDPSIGRPKLSAWQDLVKSRLQPHYDQVASIIEKVVQKFGGNPPADISKL